MQPAQVANRARGVALAILGLSFLAMILALFAPTPEGNGWFEFHINLSVNLGAFVLFVGASILFLKSLKGFTPKLKRAYFLICGGMTLFALAYLQVPILVLFSLLDNLWLNAGVTLLPFMVGVIILFSGTRVFARLIAIKHPALNYWLAIAISIVLSLFIIFLPHPEFVQTPEEEFDAGQVLLMIFATWVGLTAYNALLIKRSAGLSYTNAMAWFVLAMASVAFSAVVVAVLSLFLPEHLQDLPVDIAYRINLLASIFYLCSAYRFNRIPAEADKTERSVPRNFFGKPRQEREQRNSSSVDIVIYTANLVSSPKAIGNILQEMQVVASKVAQEPMSQVSASEEDELMKIYLNLEDYLTKQEPVRTFTRESLRNDISLKLGLTSGSLTFWDRLPSAG